MTDNQREMMLHAVGNKPGERPRNFYCASAGCPDADAWEELVSQGLATRGRSINDGCDRYYHVSMAGVAALKGTETVSDQRETAPVRLRQTTFGDLAEGARFVTLTMPYVKTEPHHFEDGPNTWGCEDDLRVVEIVNEPEPSLSLSEFAQTEQARQNSASWEGLPGRGNRGGSAKAAGDGPGASSLVAQIEAVARQIEQTTMRNTAQMLWDAAKSVALSEHENTRLRARVAELEAENKRLAELHWRM